MLGGVSTGGFLTRKVILGIRRIGATSGSRAGTGAGACASAEGAIVCACESAGDSTFGTTAVGSEDGLGYDPEFEGTGVR